MAIGVSIGSVLNLNCLAAHIVPTAVRPYHVDCGTVLEPIPVVWFSPGPVREVQGSAKVVPNPGSIVEHVRQADPESKVCLTVPTSSSNLVHQSVLLILRVDLNQEAAALLAFPS